ncbi:hypothetical protein ACNKHQ_22680 [Shigella flexneri]
MFTRYSATAYFPRGHAPGEYYRRYEHRKTQVHRHRLSASSFGSLNKDDKRYLAESFIAFFNRDYSKVAELHVEFRLGSGGRRCGRV